MNARHKIAAAGIALVIGGAGTGAAAVGGADDDAGDRVTGPAADRATRAALERFPGARVTSVERDADGAQGWEAEVTRPDGTTVDVSLDGDYRIVAIDEEGARDDAAGDDDGDADERGDDDAGEQGDDQERGDDADASATDAAARRAGEAALARVPGGRVTSIERDSDDGEAWEVEVTRSDGSRVDVDVDANLRVIAVGDPE
ncbi:MAG TPA: PepSY domain-containing protein [Solirubrobacteraceae bacterium]|nr:PepSY domain-containing protein [Solirubrobacteraceae bacterium]